LPPALLQFEPQANFCKLAYLKVPKLAKPLGKQADAYLKKFGLEKVHDAIVASEDSRVLRVILVEEGEPDWSTSINAFMIAEGLATLS